MGGRGVPPGALPRTARRGTAQSKKVHYIIRSVFGVGLPRFEISATYQNFMNAPDTAVWIHTGTVRAKVAKENAT